MWSPDWHFFWTPLNWPRGEQKPSNSNKGPQCIMPLARRPNTMEFKGVTYFPRHGLIMYAVRIAVSSHNLVPRAGTISMQCEYYTIKCIKGSQWLLCNLASLHFFFAFPTCSLWLPPLDTGSLRINCLLISYLISKQGRVNTFRASYFLSNLQANET